MVTYYVAANGSDTANGTSQSAPWRTVARVNQMMSSGNPGDQVLFRGGDTFSDAQLYITRSGTSSQPMRISSFGTGRARLGYSSSSGDAVYIYNCEYVTIDNLNVAAVSPASAKNGIEFYATNKLCAGIVISNNTVSGYTVGIRAGGSNNNRGTTGLQITGNTVSGCRGHGGIETFGQSAWTPTGYSHFDATISGNISANNPGLATDTSQATGHGFALGGLSGGLVELNTAYNNGASNGYTTGGPTGMMLWNCTGVTMQKCVAYNNKSGTTVDGCGLDLDINCTNCTLQNCISYNNDGAGILLWGYTVANSWRLNTVRWNLCWGNAVKNSYAEMYIGNDVRSSQIYNNTLVAGRGRPVVYLRNAMLAGMYLRNNLLAQRSSGAIVQSNAAMAPAQATFQQNIYSGTFRVTDGSTTFTTLAAWRSGKGQEQSGSTNTGAAGDPQMTNPAVAPPVTLATDMSGAVAFVPRAGGIADGTGQTFGGAISPGSTDLLGRGFTRLPVGALTAVPVLTVTTSSLPGGTTGQPYPATTLAASGGTTPYTWTATGLPAGLALSGAVISGTPLQAGTFTVTVTARDAAGTTAARQLTLTVITTLTITTTSLPPGATGSAYSAPLAATGGTTPYNWQATGLPAGLILAAASITGTPAIAGTATISVTVTDAAARTATTQLTLTVTGQKPVITTLLPSGRLGQSYSSELTATGGTSPYTWTVTGLPAGLAITPAGRRARAKKDSS